MRALVCFILLSVASFTAKAQDYHVVNVRGKVTITGKSGQLKPNDKLKADDKLVFSSKNDAVAVVSTKAGRFIISPLAQKKDGELMAYVKDAVTPGTKKLSTRSGLFNNALDFAQYFKDTVLFLPEMKFRTSYKQDEKSFFFVQYDYHSEKINKKLKYAGDTLIILRNELFSVDGKPVDPADVTNAHLVYMSDSKLTSFAKLNISAPDQNELIDGVKILKQLYPRNEVREETINYLNDLYGKIDEQNFDSWYKTIN